MLKPVHILSHLRTYVRMYSMYVHTYVRMYYMYCSHLCCCNCVVVLFPSISLLTCPSSFLLPLPSPSLPFHPLPSSTPSPPLLFPTPSPLPFSPLPSPPLLYPLPSPPLSYSLSPPLLSPPLLFPTPSPLPFSPLPSPPLLYPLPSPPLLYPLPSPPLSYSLSPPLLSLSIPSPPLPPPLPSSFLLPLPSPSLPSLLCTIPSFPSCSLPLTHLTLPSPTPQPHIMISHICTVVTVQVPSSSPLPSHSLTSLYCDPTNVRTRDVITCGVVPVLHRWLEACLEDELPPTTAMEQALRNGVFLARLSHFFAPEVVPLKKIYDIDESKYRVSFNHMYIRSYAVSLNVCT